MCIKLKILGFIMNEKGASSQEYVKQQQHMDMYKIDRDKWFKATNAWSTMLFVQLEMCIIKLKENNHRDG